MTPPTIFILHGIGGNPDENWFPWLKQELKKMGRTVIVPQFPHADQPKLNEWQEYFKQYAITPDSILVGHSLGGMFALRVLEESATPIRATFLVAPVTGPSDGKSYAPLMTTFTEKPLNIDVIKRNGGSVHILHADDDPYISLENAQHLAKELGIAVDVIPNGGHLGAGAGYSAFPHLLEQILALP